jgi:hypothetical protein
VTEEIEEVEDQNVTCEMLVLEKCFFGGRRCSPGQTVMYDGPASQIPFYLTPHNPHPLPVAQAAPTTPPATPPTVSPNPGVRDEPGVATSNEPVSAQHLPNPEHVTRESVLADAVGSLDVTDASLWSANTGRPKVGAVNAVLAKAGAELTNAAELQMVSFINDKAMS